MKLAHQAALVLLASTVAQGATPSPVLRRLTFEAVAFDMVEISLADQTIHVEVRDGGLRLGGASGIVRMNAGIFEPNYVPTGLVVSSGKELHSLNRRGGRGNFYLTPNGVFAIRKGRAVIEETAGFDFRDVSEATQSGPMLVHHRKIHPAFRASSQNKLIRNAVGVRDDGHVFFVISRDPVTFWTLARFFRDLLRCENALYLDGTISALWAENGGADEELQKGPFAAVLTVR